MKRTSLIVMSIMALIFFTGCGEDSATNTLSSEQIKTDDENNDSASDQANGDNSGATGNNGSGGNVGTAGCSTGNLVTADTMDDLQPLTAVVSDCVLFEVNEPAGIDPNISATQIRYRWFRGVSFIAESPTPRLRLDNVKDDDGGLFTVRLEIDGNVLLETSALLTINPAN